MGPKESTIDFLTQPPSSPQQSVLSSAAEEESASSEHIDEPREDRFLSSPVTDRLVDSAMRSPDVTSNSFLLTQEEAGGSPSSIEETKADDRSENVVNTGEIMLTLPLENASTPQEEIVSSWDDLALDNDEDSNEDKGEESDDSAPADDSSLNFENSLLALRAENMRRNASRLKLLGLEDKTKSTQKKPKRKATSPDVVEDETEEPPTGMLFSTRVNNISPSCDMQDVTQLCEQYPFRSQQIMFLQSLVGATLGEAFRHDGAETNQVYVPSPIFITGPGGTGKTALVRSFVDTLKRQFSSPTREPTGDRPLLGTAYVNCATIDPFSLEAIVESAFSQLVSDVDIGDSSRRRRKHKSKRRRGGDRSSGENTSMPAISTLENQKPNDLDYEQEDEALVEERIEQTRTQMSQTIQMRHTRSKTCDAGATGSATAAANGAQSQSLVPQVDAAGRKVENATVSHGAAAAFGRALSPFFGSGALASRPSCAFLILDQAERLLSLSSKKTADSNNYLAQLLLLPKALGLNLTVIVISSSTMLEYTRINNLSSVQNALGNISSAVRPIRIHFPAYSGKAAFKKILATPDMLERITGGLDGRMATTVVSSFLETLIQSLMGVTRDVREIVRLGRMLWPKYIIPLHPRTINSTMEAVRKRVSQQSASNDADEPSDQMIEKEIRMLLDEKILPQLNSCIEEYTFVLHKKSKASDQELPYLSKCLLLAAFICQHNKADKDKKLFTIQKNGQKNRRNHTRTGGADSVAYGSEHHKLKTLRPRQFSLERMLSVFVSIVGLNQPEDKLLIPEGVTDMRQVVRAMGCSVFFDSLAELREIGFLHGGSGLATESMDLTMPKYSCEVKPDDADALATSIGLPLSNYLLH